MRFRRFLASALIVPITAAAGPAPVGYLRVAPAMARVAQERAEYGLKNGIDAGYAFPALKAHFKTAEDHHYLNGLRASLPDSYVYKFSGHRTLPRGYAVTLASGQTVEIVVDRNGRLVFNGQMIDVGRLSARGTLEALDAGLKVRHASVFDLFPRAEAEPFSIGILIALAAVAMYTAFQVVTDKSVAKKLRDTKFISPAEAKAAPAALDQALALCESERGQLKFVDSVSAKLLAQLQDDQVGADLVADFDCESYPAAVAAKGHTDLKPADLKVVCYKAKTYQACLKRFRDEGLSPKVEGAGASPSAPGAGASPTAK